jgi:hypothetical protein
MKLQDPSIAINPAKITRAVKVLFLYVGSGYMPGWIIASSFDEASKIYWTRLSSSPVSTVISLAMLKATVA